MLVVDDDDVIRQLITVNLELEGFEVVPAVDGQDALDKAKDADVQVVTLVAVWQVAQPGPLPLAAGLAYGLVCDVLIVRGLTVSAARSVGAANAVITPPASPNMPMRRRVRITRLPPVGAFRPGRAGE